MFEQALALYEKIGDRYSTARCQLFFGLSRKQAGELDRARQLLLAARQGLAAIIPQALEWIDQQLSEMVSES
ncbi:MAG: hypothetical protein ACREEM_52385 [Blastocatellia bacterium]